LNLDLKIFMMDGGFASSSSFLAFSSNSSLSYLISSNSI
jgi:hypothetical protein